MRSTECETALTFRLSTELADKLRNMARRKSLFERRSVSVAFLVRAAVEQAYAGEQSPGQPATTTNCGETPNPEAT